MDNRDHSTTPTLTTTTTTDQLPPFKINPHSLSHLSPTHQSHFQTNTRGPRHQPSHPTIPHSITHHTLLHPQTPAIHHGPHTLTYSQLHHHSHNLARILISHGVEKGDYVGVFMRRGVEFVVGLSGVLYAGACYVPQDVGVCPKGVLGGIVGDCGMKVVLTVRRNFGDVMEVVGDREEVVVVCVDEIVVGEGIRGDVGVADVGVGDVVERGVGKEDKCFVIFTSGTTGRPKGVVVSHGNVVNVLLTYPGCLGIREGWKVGSLLSVGFDMGQWEILGCLGNGGTLVMRGLGLGFQGVAEIVDVLIATPSILGGIDVTKCRGVKKVAVAGEVCPKKLAESWGEVVDEFWNCCGPTETTIINTGKRWVKGESGVLTVGKPTPNNLVYILDDELRAMKIGEIGEMWAGGDGVTKGYLGREDLTRERYRPDPFLGGGRLMYRTGDLGRWNERGELEHLGRVDDQVKIKGFRIELDGVGAVMEKTEGVVQAVALKVEEKIVAFVRPASAKSGLVKETVKMHLPYYCVPARVVSLDEFPKTTNGKVAKKKLRKVAKEALNVDIEDSASVRDLALAYGAAMKRDSTGNEKSHHSLHFINAIEKNKKDKENTVIDIDSSSTNEDGGDDWYDEVVKLPAKQGNKNKARRFRKYVAFSHHRRFIALVTIVNILVFALGFVRKKWWLHLGLLSTIVFGNITAAILFRQQRMVNLFFRIATLIPTSWSLSIRWSMGKVYHFGGLHSGSAVSGTAWFFIFLGSAIWQRATQMPGISVATIVLTCILVLLLLLVVIFALPGPRMKLHNNFEMTHRFGGWTILLVAWAVTFVFVNDQRQVDPASSPSYGVALVSTPGFWLLLASTISVILPWLYLKKVRVDIKVPSNHAAIVTFNHGVTPLVGSSSQVSLSPLFEWHSFANIPAPGRKGFRLIISRAGDWTSNFIDNPPSQVWVRGIPTAGVANIETLFKKVLYVATGSGIGPVLPHLLFKRVPSNLVWTTRTPRKTFGDELVDEILAADPEAYIHDTTTAGKPNMVELSYKACRYFRAEAAIVISNQKLTRKMVYGLESRGIPCFGAIWDS